MQPLLFIDRDGTIVQETDDEKVDKIEKLTFLPDVLFYLRKICEETDFILVMVTNQDGVGTSHFPEEEFWPVHDFIIRTLEGEQIRFEAVHIDTHYESDNHPDRKPNTGMLTHYMNGFFNLANSYVIGDRVSDVQLARNLGSKAIHICSERQTDAELTTESWKEIYEFLVSD